MKSCILFLFIVMMTLPLFSQEGNIQSVTIPAPSIDQDIKVTIYTPPGYSYTNETPYRVYIFLHGGAGSVEAKYAEFMQPTLDDLINSGEIEPIVVVYPVLKFKTVHGKNIPLDAHFYTDSERNGNYSSVITKDLLEWLPMWYNVTSRREGRAIGGFSMGGDGSLRIAIRNSDKFVACASHDGTPAIRAYLNWKHFLMDELLGTPKRFGASHGFWSAIWFGAASAFSPNMTSPNMPEWFLDFPVDITGAVIDSVFYGKWMQHDAATLIRDRSIYANDLAIFFDGTDDGYVENDMFHNDLLAIGIPHTYERLSGGHGLYTQTIRSSLKFIDNAMDDALAQKSYQRDVRVQAPFDRIEQLNIYSNGKYIPTAMIKNMGSNTLSKLELSCEILQESVVVYSENVTINSLPSQNSMDIVFPAWQPEQAFDYHVKIFSTLTTDQNKKNDTLRTELSVSTLVDDFENGLTTWADNKEWETINKDSLGENFCVGHTPYFNYDNNCDSWLIPTNSFDFSHLKAAELQFETRYLFADNGDFGLIKVSLDNGETWTQAGDTLKGVMDEWQQIKISLNDFSGPGFENVLLGFEMITDAQGTAIGWFLDDIVLNVEEYPVSVASSDIHIDHFSLSQNYPNPFNSSTTIRFEMSRSSHIKLKIYNLLGKEVETLINEQRPAGEYKIEWDASVLPSGLYFCRLQAENFDQTRKLILQN